MRAGTRPEVFVAGRPVALGTLLGCGGEGEVWSVAADSGAAAKIYQRPPSEDRRAKIAAMIALSTS